MYFSRGLCREDRGKTKKMFTAVLALSWAFSVTAAERIVVAGGSLTELIYAMGAGERVVGVDERHLIHQKPPNCRILATGNNSTAKAFCHFARIA